MKRSLPLLLLTLVAVSGCGGGSGNDAAGGTSPVVTLSAATSVTDNSAVLNGSVNPYGLPTEYWFEYGTDPSLATYDNNPKQSAGSGTTAQAVAWTLNGLGAGTKYYHRICASNGAGTTRSPIGSFTTSSVPPSAALYRADFDFSPYEDGQDPNLGTPIGEEQVRERLAIIAPYSTRIRTFGTEDGLEAIPRIARNEYGFKAYAGAWLDNDLTANERQLANLIAIGQAGEADALIVGSETLLDNTLTPTRLIDYIRRVKQAVPDVSVTTADAYTTWLDHPELIAEVDFLMVNYYPYWEGVRLSWALSYVHAYHQEVLAAAGGKSVEVSESGWPSAGDTFGNAVPSPGNAASYFLNFVSWARANSVPYFYFEAFDEKWKVAEEGEQGGHWGVWDNNGILKPDMQAVFDNQTMADNWSVPCGPGAVSVEFTSVPALGSFADLYGQACGVAPADYKVAVYIYVPGAGWWIKPYDTTPLSGIAVNGSWRCDITTGGSDETATQIAAYLIPNGYTPPIVLGDATLPAELDQNAAAKTWVDR